MVTSESVSSDFESDKEGHRHLESIPSTASVPNQNENDPCPVPVETSDKEPAINHLLLQAPPWLRGALLETSKVNQPEQPTLAPEKAPPPPTQLLGLKAMFEKHGYRGNIEIQKRRNQND